MIGHDLYGAAPTAVAPILASSGSKGAGLTGGEVAEPSGDDARDLPLQPAGNPAGHPPLARTLTLIDGTDRPPRGVVPPGTASFIDVDEASSDAARRGASTRTLGVGAPPR